ncbi:DoxX family protein [Pseudonocardia spinosispora]|uniref:DoxX family protein n=1 Tax=Pseudonocardia spinosispora TaxID=103441 RepID=UPI0004902623|nr:DoxX family membrane protein [Pseudonocardia spinosispora]
MEPLIALVVVTLVLASAAAAGVRRLRPWTVPLRAGVAVMFLLTGGAHFIGLREQMIAMVPPVLPAPGLLVTVTGVLELAGAIGVLLPATARLAAGCLTVLLIVMFPANVYAAVAGVLTAPEDALLPRTLMQVVFVAATSAIAWCTPGRARREITPVEV